MMLIILTVSYINASEMNGNCSAQTDEIQGFELQKDKKKTKPFSKKLTSFWGAVVQKCTPRKKNKVETKFETLKDHNNESTEQKQFVNDNKDAAKTTENMFINSKPEKSVDEDGNKGEILESSDNENHGGQDIRDIAKSTESIYLNPKSVKRENEDGNKSVYRNPFDEEDEAETIGSIDEIKTAESTLLDPENVNLTNQIDSKSTMFQLSKNTNPKSFEVSSNVPKKSRKKRRAPGPPNLNKEKSLNPFDSSNESLNTA